MANRNSWPSQRSRLPLNRLVYPCRLVKGKIDNLEDVLLRRGCHVLAFGPRNRVRGKVNRLRKKQKRPFAPLSSMRKIKASLFGAA